MRKSISKQRKIGQQLLFVDLIQSERPRSVYRGILYPITTSVADMTDFDFEEVKAISHYCALLDGLSLSYKTAFEIMKAKKKSDSFCVFYAQFLHRFGKLISICQYDGSDSYVNAEQLIINELLHEYSFNVSPDDYLHTELYEAICSYRTRIHTCVSQAVADGFDMDVIKRMTVGIRDIELFV